MKIGIDCRLWDETGVGRYIRNLVYNLQKIDKKNEYVLFVLSKDYEAVKFQISSRFDWDKFQIVKADVRWHSIAEQLEFPKILKKENLDLMHFSYFSVPIFYNRPYVVTIHDLIINHFPTGKASTLPFPIYSLKLLGYKFLIVQAARKAKKIITVSNATKKEILDHLKVSEGKIIVAYEGIDDKVTNLNSAMQNQLPNKFKNTKYFLYVGNAYPHKNLERLLKAFNMLIDTNISLVLVGKDDYFYKRLKKKVEEMKLLDKVIFLKNVNDEELANLYKNAIALVVPSLMEGFGLPALEAMANKCLVLASDIPSLKETCGNAALYFNPLSIDELADKFRMVSLHTTEYGRLEELRKKGVERARKFSWRKMAEETLQVYEDSVSI